MGSRHTLPGQCCPLVVLRRQRHYDLLRLSRISCDFQFPVVSAVSGVYILIAVGAVMMLVGFLGCYGAIQESQCLLGTVSSSLFTLIQLGTLLFTRRLKGSNNLLHFLSLVFLLFGDPLCL